MLSQHSHEHGCHEAVSAIQACALRMNTLVASTETETAAAFVYLTVACAAENHNSWRAVEYLEGVKARISKWILNHSYQCCNPTQIRYGK